MRAIVSTSLVFLLMAPGCKPLEESSTTRSFVGLNAELDPSILRGDAPSFLYLQQWFNGELPVDVAKAQAGDVDYKVHGEFTESTMSSLPREYRDKLSDYLRQQQARIAEFQANLDRPEKLNELLKLEATEMADILMALIEPGYEPRTKDLLAHLVAHKPMRSFIDRYSVELLEKLYARSQRSLILGLEKERDNFAKILSKSYVNDRGATEKFRNALEANCAKIATLLRSMSAPSRVGCKGSSQTQLTGNRDLASSVKSLGGAPGKAFGVMGAMSAPGGFAASGVSPRLRIFNGRDPNANDPYAAGDNHVAGENSNQPQSQNQAAKNSPSNNNAGPDSPIDNNSQDNNQNNNNPNISQGSDNFLGLLLGVLSHFMDQGGMSLTSTQLASEPFDIPVPPKPRGVCRNRSGLELVGCQRYIETMRPASSLISSNKNPLSLLELGDGSLQLSDDSAPSNSSGYNFYMISKYATRVQHQGTEGACTAFGLAHTLGILGRIKGKSGEYNAWDIWRAQGQQMFMDAALGAAKRKSFDGLRITSARTVAPTVSGFKKALDLGRPIYIGTDTDSSWDGAWRGNGNLTCRGSSGAMGHAYSIVGYDDSSQKFIIKNSWGDSWGDKGYGYLPYSCIGRMGERNGGGPYSIEIN